MSQLLSENDMWELTEPTPSVLTMKGGEFHKKLWYCVGGRVKQDDLVLSIELIT